MIDQHNLPDQVETAVDFAARDITRSIVDATGGHKNYASILRMVSGLVRGISATALAGARDSSWTTAGGGSWWLTRTADTGPGGLDKNALSQAVREWWDGLDDAGKYKAIIGKKPERGDQFVNEKIQHFQNKTEQELAAEDPKLLEAYRRVKPAGAAAPAAPASAAPAAPAAPAKPAAPPAPPKAPEETPEDRAVFEGGQ